MQDATVATVNLALSHLGEEPVADLSDASQAGSIALIKIMRVIWEAKAEILSRHGWTCALEYPTLQPATIQNYVPPPSYPWVYLLPDDCLRLWTIEGVCCGTGCYSDQAANAYFEPRWQVGTTKASGADQKIIRGAPLLYTQALDGVGWGGPDGYFYGEGWSSAPSAQDCIPILGQTTPAPTTSSCAGPPLNISYVRDCDFAALDRSLRKAIAKMAAGMAGYGINGDQGRADALMKMAEEDVAMAVGDEANQEGGQAPLAASIPAALRMWGRV